MPSKRAVMTPVFRSRLRWPGCFKGRSNPFLQWKSDARKYNAPSDIHTTCGTDVNGPLLIRDGVAPSYRWLPAGRWLTVLAFLEEQFPHIERETWLSRMDKGEVVDRDGRKVSPTSPYREGDRIFYYRELDAETPIPFEETILFRDDHLLVADKPHFLPVIPTGRFLHETLLVRLKKKTGLENLTPIHRIDRETAGVVIFSHNIATRGDYQSLFQKHAMRKIYQAIAPTLGSANFPITHRSCMVEGTPFFRMKEVEGILNSETWIDLIESRGAHSLYELRPVTGKKHQLRVHLASLGIPIVNDPFYPDALACKEDDVSHPLQLLAKAISFEDSLTGKERYFESGRSLEFP